MQRLLAPTFKYAACAPGKLVQNIPIVSHVGERVPTGSAGPLPRRTVLIGKNVAVLKLSCSATEELRCIKARKCLGPLRVHFIQAWIWRGREALERKGEVDGCQDAGPQGAWG